MAYNAKQIVDALREAQGLARSHQCRTYVIAQGSRLKAVTRPMEGDVVVIDGIIPAGENWDANRVAQEALEHVPDAIPAIERMMDIIDRDGAGKPRSSAFKEEVFDALLSYYGSLEHSKNIEKLRAREILQMPKPPQESFWFRLWGLRAG